MRRLSGLLMIKVLPIGDTLREDVPYGHKHFSGDCHLDFLSVLVPDDCLRIAESVEEAVPGLRCRPGAFPIDFRRYLLPCVILRDLIFPALSSFLGFRPAHETSADDVSNVPISTPTSAIMAVAERSPTPGIVCMFSKCLGK